MRRALWAVPLLAVFCAWFARGAYSYYYTENGASPAWSNWIVQNNGGQLAAYYNSSGGYGGIAFDTYGGSGRMTYPSTSSSPGEMKLIFRTASAATGNATVYLSASTDLSAPGASPAGSGYMIDFQTGLTGSNYSLSKIVNGQFTVVSSGAFAPGHDLMTLRFVRNSNGLILGYLDNVRFLQYSDTSYTSGRMAVERAWSTYQPASGPLLTQIDLGNLDSTAPNAISSGSISATPFYNHVDIQWPAATDDANGTGIYNYEIYRNGWLVGSTQDLSFADMTVAPSTTYTYALKPVDFHGNAASTTFSVTTPAVGPEGRRTGVRSTGAYWGAGGENIDVLSGNLNFSLPLLKAQARGGWGVGFNLNYNSQNWRYDASTSWKYGVDVGYGFGWRLMAGSITPKFADAYSVNYYLFTDSTGAEYRLDQNASNVWSSKESVYVYFDANINRLWFTNGSWWDFGCTSASGEADSGVMYPTNMEDSNGNQIIVRYQAGKGSSAINTSARITGVEDTRGNGSNAYIFTYTTVDSTPHLASIASQIGTGENYSFDYWTSQALSSPFNSQAFGNTTMMKTVTANNYPNNLYHQFTYNGSGELTNILLPHKGYLAYDYTTTAYSNGLSYREVVRRYLSKDGIASTQYPFSHEASVSAPIHQFTQLDDPGGVGQKYWTFAATGATAGLVTQYKGNQLPGPVTKAQNDYTWVQDAVGNSYIGSATTTADPGQSYAAAKKTDQTVDIRGNVTQVKTYEYGNLTTPVRTDNFTYLTGGGYPSRYIFNRLTSSPTTSISYDQFSLTSLSGLYEWDSSIQNFPRGNPTTVTSLGATQTMHYNIAGGVTSSTNASGVTSSVTTTSATNYSAPSQITVGSFSTSMSYNQFLGLTNETGPNGVSTSIGYDAVARPNSATSPFGATSTTTYYDTYTPAFAVSSVNGRWTKTSMDGLGRTTKVETGYSSTTVSVSETEYDSCGCSPTGKVKRTSLPHAPAATQIWTTYTYDGIGRTLTSTTAGTETTSTTTYLYQGNTVKVTDAAGKWKKYTSNALGQLTQANEPNPAGGSDYVTTYTYDTLGHLTGVSMPRPSGTQTRTFNYGNPPGTQLLSATNPENGTVSYSYNSDRTLAEKIDAKNQRVQYSYDAYKRVTQVRRGIWGVVPNVIVINAQRYGQTAITVMSGNSTVGTTNYGADNNPQNFTFTTSLNLSPNNLRVIYNAPSNTVSINSLTLNGTQYQGYLDTCDDYNCYVDFYTAPAGGQTPGFQEDTCQREDYSYDTNPYDGSFSQYTLGRLAAVQYKGGDAGGTTRTCPTTFTEMYSYSQAGAVLKKRLRVARSSSLDLDAVYTYDNEGRMTATQYPSTWTGYSWVAGPNLGNSFDSMGRLQRLTDLTASSDIITNATYNPAGQLMTMSGNSAAGVSETREYNSIGQLTHVFSCPTYYGCTQTLNVLYNYSSTQNNGKIASQTDALSGETVSYTYDSLNRLATATGSGWGQSYAYDGFGNLTNQTVTSGTAPSLSVSYDPATNRRTGECSDANGNLCDGDYIYDIENRIIRKGVWWHANPDVAYSYAPGNKRIWRGAWDGNGTQTVDELTFWGANGQKLATYALSVYGSSLVATATGTNQYFGGKLVKNTSGYVTPDRLGSIGKYFPYGQERPSATTDGKEKFATYFRDSETGLDYAKARYHQPGMGRFMTPDQINGTPEDPATWNKYAYVGSDPVNHKDPGGTMWCNADGECRSDTDCWAARDKDWNGDPSEMYTFCQNAAWYPDPSRGPLGDSGIDPGTGISPDPLPILMATVLSAATHASLVSAAIFITDMSFSEGCKNDLYSITNPRNGGDNATTAGMQAAAGGAFFINFFLAPSDYKAAFDKGAYMVADVPLTDAGVGILRNIYYRPGFETGKSSEEIRGAVMHELLHNMGFLDTDIQKGLGLDQVPGFDPRYTDDITQKLATDCFGKK